MHTPTVRHPILRVHKFLRIQRIFYYNTIDSSFLYEQPNGKLKILMYGFFMPLLGGIFTKVSEKMDEVRIKDALGKYLTVNILSQNDELIAKRGDIITHHIIEKAKTEGMLEKVLANNSKKSLP